VTTGGVVGIVVVAVVAAVAIDVTFLQVGLGTSSPSPPPLRTDTIFTAGLRFLVSFQLSGTGAAFTAGLRFLVSFQLNGTSSPSVIVMVMVVMALLTIILFRRMILMDPMN
jgi:hypothetical protein